MSGNEVCFYRKCLCVAGGLATQADSTQTLLPPIPPHPARCPRLQFGSLHKDPVVSPLHTPALPTGVRNLFRSREFGLTDYCSQVHSRQPNGPCSSCPCAFSASPPLPARPHPEAPSPAGPSVRLALCPLLPAAVRCVPADSLLGLCLCELLRAETYPHLSPLGCPQGRQSDTCSWWGGGRENQPVE